MRCIVPYCLPSRATSCKGAFNAAKVQYKLRVVFGVNLLRYESMEWNIEENFSMEWNGRFLVWNGIWNGRKLPVWNMKKSSSISYHALPETP